MVQSALPRSSRVVSTIGRARGTTGGTWRATGRVGRRTGLLFLVVSGPKCFATLQPSGFDDWKSQRDDGRHRESHGETWKTHWTTLPRSQWSKVLCHAPAEWFRRLEEPEGRRGGRHGETWKTHWTTLPRSQWSKVLCHAPAEWFRRLEEPEGRRGRHGETWKTHWTTLPRSQWSKVLCHAPAE